MYVQVGLCVGLGILMTMTVDDKYTNFNSLRLPYATHIGDLILYQALNMHNKL